VSKGKPNNHTLDGCTKMNGTKGGLRGKREVGNREQRKTEERDYIHHGGRRN